MGDRDCPFCQGEELENNTWVARWDPFPVNIGHMKLIPKRHDADLFNFTRDEQLDFFNLLQRVKKYLDNSLKNRPDGYNIGINIGEAAGQTMQHLHVHVIPRYVGDVPNPRGGVRNIKRPLVKW